MKKSKRGASPEVTIKDESTKWLLSIEERKTLGARAKRESIECPECGVRADRSPANGRWRCLSIFCRAAGRTVNGDLITTEALARED